MINYGEEATVVKLNIKKIISLICMAVALLLPAHANDDCAVGRHQDDLVEYVPATETMDGKSVYQCILCQRRYTDIEYATAHVWSGWVIAVPACIPPIQRYRTCSVDAEHIQWEEIETDGHTYVQEIRIAATCENDGEARYVCACGDSYEKTLSMLGGHDHAETVAIAPNCKTDGVMTLTCVCGDSYTEPIPMTPHAYSDWIVDREPQAGIEGLRHKECAYGCGLPVTEILPALSVAVRPSLNGIDAALAGLNLVMAAVFLALILSDIHLLRWNKRRCEQVRSRQRQQRTEGDDYDFV